MPITGETPVQAVLMAISHFYGNIGGATPKFLDGPNLRPTHSITSFSTQGKK